MRRNVLYNSKLKDRARELRKDPTPAEKKIWFQYFKKLNHRFLRQRPIGNFIVDFYCPALKLVIEVDGDIHLSEETVEYDRERTAYLEGLDIQVVRIANNDVYNNFSEVIQMLDKLISSYYEEEFI